MVSDVFGRAPLPAIRVSGVFVVDEEDVFVGVAETATLAEVIYGPKKFTVATLADRSVAVSPPKWGRGHRGW